MGEGKIKKEEGRSLPEVMSGERRAFARGFHLR
jgi:hypothetical protein